MAKGLYTNSELIETIIVDLNNLIKNAIDGQFIQCSTIVVGMSQKLINLRQTIDNDLKNRNQTIEELKQRLRDLGQEIVEISPEELIKERDGVKNGSN